MCKCKWCSFWRKIQLVPSGTGTRKEGINFNTRIRRRKEAAR